MTSEEIRAKLNLLPFDEFEYNSLLNLKVRSHYLTYTVAVNERYRQTGRSIKIICELLSDASNNNKVVFISFNTQSTQIWFERIKQMAHKLNIHEDLIYSATNLDQFKGTDVKIYHDHQLL